MLKWEQVPNCLMTLWQNVTDDCLMPLEDYLAGNGTQMGSMQALFGGALPIDEEDMMQAVEDFIETLNDTCSSGESSPSNSISARPLKL